MTRSPAAAHDRAIVSREMDVNAVWDAVAKLRDHPAAMLNPYATSLILAHRRLGEIVAKLVRGAA